MAKDWPELLKHDFIAKSQGSYFAKQKESAGPGVFVVALDFAMNYTFHVQNAVQSQHWANNQATLHPYVIYYKEGDEVKHINYVTISEKITHDADSVHLFNSKLIAFLKGKFGETNVKKIIYFSDGAGSQYKNKFNFINLVHHKADFGVEVEWNFFATSHGKGACDGIGGTVKKHAYTCSLQRINSRHITTAKALYEWACSFFKKISFEFCSQEEHDTHSEKMKSRYEKAVTIKNTRQYHHYKPVDAEKIACKVFSEDQKVTNNLVVKIDKKKKLRGSE